MFLLSFSLLCIIFIHIKEHKSTCIGRFFYYFWSRLACSVPCTCFYSNNNWIISCMFLL
jgi:hypothetical protein